LNKLDGRDSISGFEFSAEVIVVGVMQGKCNPLYLVPFTEQQELGIFQAALLQPYRG
jgi:hypothetical protein